MSRKTALTLTTPSKSSLLDSGVKPDQAELPTRQDAASFRDPAGFLFRSGGQLYRQVNHAGREDYDLLMNSGLYRKLVEKGWLIPHRELEAPAADPDLAYKILQPQALDFVSYPYEWCFSQLKDAALLTLAILKLALEFGGILKDSSAYNIQFQGGRPLLIDTLSFTRYAEGSPWDGYRQFCQHFLAPLALASNTDVRLAQLLRVHLDGIPLDLASRLLPRRTRLLGGLYLHIHLHASAQKKYAGRPVAADGPRKVSKIQLLGLIDSLETTVKKLEWNPAGTAWADYDRQHNYSANALEAKKQILKRFLAQASPQVVWDVGANTGEFSRIAAQTARLVVSMDIDPGAVELNYRQCRQEKQAKLLPLLVDLINPSPGLGWRSRERSSLEARAGADLVMALALIHHLAIGNNLPLGAIANFFAACGEWLVIEFVPKEDSQVQRLLASRKDIFPDYHAGAFEAIFQRDFTLLSREEIPGSARTLYLFRCKTGAGG